MQILTMLLKKSVVDYREGELGSPVGGVWPAFMSQLNEDAI